MKVLSIDVGLKNLAYCLFYIDKNNNKKYEIDSWDIVDVCDLTSNICQKCKKQAKCKKDDLLLCRLHAKKHPSYKIPPHKDKTIKKMKKLKLIELCSTYDLEVSKKDKKDDIVKKIFEHHNKHYFSLIENVNANNIDLITLGRNMTIQFDKIFSKTKIDNVIIENQISPIANRMKTFQGMITQYFIMKNVPIIEFIASSNKLKMFIQKKKTTYAERKKQSIIFTKKIISSNNMFNKWLEHFSSNKKKDDLADCFLQGIYYLENKYLMRLT